MSISKSNSVVPLKKKNLVWIPVSFYACYPATHGIRQTDGIKF